MLEAQKITKIFGARIVLRDVNFSLNVGQVLHVAGSNGTGKTTLLRIAVGLLHPDAGTINSSIPVSHLCEYLATNMRAFFPHLTALDNILWWARLKNRELSLAKVSIALQKAGIKFPKSLPVQYFSTGMLRKLHLARFMLSPASVWVIDEPFAGLDADGRASFSAAITAHVDDGGAVIVASHDERPIASRVSQTLDLDARV
ncbi:MAG: heme ABC exporter ATP-binding protein CcmA [Pseudomonadota bacterium]|nr:heme ABC exporter ATP-binding protein CcmA [Pseudomonadota bacterium]